MSNPGTIRIRRWDRDLGRYVEVVRKGKVFELDGKMIELFQTRVFAEALDRTSQSIQRWHRENAIPRPMFKVPGTRDLRWYSKWQILNVAHIYQTKFDRKNRYFDKQTFMKEVHEVWSKTEYIPGVEVQ